MDRRSFPGAADATLPPFTVEISAQACPSRPIRIVIIPGSGGAAGNR